MAALTVPSSSWPEFSQDGRIVVSSDDKLTTYQVDPALEYRTLARATIQPIEYAHASIGHDERILAVGTEHGVVLWDLAQGTELGLLGIGLAYHSLFEESGDLLTSGSLGVWRWPVKVDTDRGVVQIGPPGRLHLPPGDCEIAEDRQGRIVAEANHTYVTILTPQRTFKVEPLEDARSVALSPDGQWLGTASHAAGGVHIWRISDGSEVVKLPAVPNGGVRFSPDGKWLLTSAAPCRLWAVGTWLEARQVGGRGLCFSPDGRLLAVMDDSKIIRIVETETGRTVARLESPDLCAAEYASFSPGGARLVVTTKDGPAVHVWDLRAIRKLLAEMGLDWDAPAYLATEPAAAHAPDAPLKLIVDMGASGSELRSLLDRALELERAGKIREAIGVLREVCRQWPDVSLAHNNLAWLLATGPEPLRDPTEALEHARQAVRVAPAEQTTLNTLGVALYRAGKFADAITILKKSLDAGKGQLSAFDLFFLSMAHHRLGHRADARGCFDRAVRWVGEQQTLPAQYAKDLAEFRAEAEAVLAGTSDELPANVFAKP